MNKFIGKIAASTTALTAGALIALAPSASASGQVSISHSEPGSQLTGYYWMDSSGNTNVRIWLKDTGHDNHDAVGDFHWTKDCCAIHLSTSKGTGDQKYYYFWKKGKAQFRVRNGVGNNFWDNDSYSKWSYFN